MFLRYAISIIMVITGAAVATSCPSKTLIMSELAVKDFAVEIIRKMQKYQEADPRLTNTVVATVLFSIDKHTEFLVPWSSNLTQIQQRINGFQKSGAFSSFQLPQNNNDKQAADKHTGIAADKHTGIAAADKHTSVAAADKHTSIAVDRTVLKKKRLGSNITDPLMQQVNLGLRFFRQNETGTILLLTSIAENTKLTDKVLEGRNITLAIGYTSGNEYLENKDSSDSLKFVEISHDAKIKQTGIARFLVYANCTPPEKLNEYQAIPNDIIATELPPLNESENRKSSVIAAGSVAAASAGVAAISVFAGRWFYNRRFNEDVDYGRRHYPTGEVETTAGYETPVAHDQSSLDIDNHTTPDQIRRTDTDSSVQHIAFTMF